MQLRKCGNVCALFRTRVAIRTVGGFWVAASTDNLRFRRIKVRTRICFIVLDGSRSVASQELKGRERINY